MTRAEALAEARRRWGRRAYAYESRQPSGVWRFIVGASHDFDAIGGHSDESWRAAFDYADARAATK